eukprot:TRINITY_DN5464_c0_g1_i1.p1 TRINITY_DN5464_c0_g1~~TRINITY_DN5464_c0_g1_i1.p1  ORF type:complete len:413 (+),score=46.57 TRINITY_DN5464_c0_g1_i1:630-1868(+)
MLTESHKAGLRKISTETTMVDLNKLLTPNVTLSEERPIDKNDYESYLRSTCDYLKSIDKYDIPNDKMSLAVIVVAEHSKICDSMLTEEELIWSSEEFEIFRDKLRIKIEEKHLTFQEAVNCNFGAVFSILEPKLKKWSENPASCHAITYLVTQVSETKILEEHIGRLLPFILRWCDSWMVRPRLLAARILLPLLDNTNSANLTKFGRDKVVYDALVKVLSAEDAAVLRVSAVPLVKVLGIMCAGESRVTVSQVDLFMDKLFSSIELETKVDKKTAKLELLDSTWPLAQDAALRWIPKLANLISGELDIANYSTKLLLDLWQFECRQHAAATAREGVTMLPALVKTLWKHCNGYLSEGKIDREDIISTLGAQIRVDLVYFAKCASGLDKCSQNTEFSDAIKEAIRLSECDNLK